MKEYRTPFVSLVGPAASNIQGINGNGDGGDPQTFGVSDLATTLEEE
jgi:hypothetical protein